MGNGLDPPQDSKAIDAGAKPMLIYQNILT